MSLIAPGLRTDAEPGWRAGVAAAVSVAMGEPKLWLLGALGFAARGGLIFLALPIVTIPSPVVLSLIFRGQLSSAGLADGSVGVLTAAAVVSVVLIALALLAAAFADVAAFELLADDPETGDLRTDVAARRFDRRDRLRSVLTLASIQAVALAPAVLIAALVAARMEAAFLQELTSPSSFTTPLFLRVIGAASEPLVALGIALVGADLVYSLAGRAVLVTRAGLDHRGALGHRGTARSALGGALRLATRPGRTVATALLAWPVTILVLTPVVWAAGVAWSGVRSVFLTTSGWSDPAVVPAVFLMTVIFAAIWVAAIILAGFASAVRAALWSADALR